jgi:hypothetical protein
VSAGGHPYETVPGGAVRIHGSILGAIRRRQRYPTELGVSTLDLLADRLNDLVDDEGSWWDPTVFSDSAAVRQGTDSEVGGLLSHAVVLVGTVGRAVAAARRAHRVIG